MMSKLLRASRKKTSSSFSYPKSTFPLLSDLKLSVHCLSQKPRPKKVSLAAAQAFADLVRTAGFAVDEAACKKEMVSDPALTVIDFREVLERHLGRTRRQSRRGSATP